MSNSLYQSLNNNYNNLPNNNNNNIKQLIGLFKNSNNPQQLFFHLMQNNPRIKNIYSMLQNSNKSPKELFYSLAQQKGINPEDVLQMLK